MLGVTGGRRPCNTWRIPAGFVERYDGVSSSVLTRCQELAGGDPMRVTRDIFIQAIREALPDMNQSEDDYARQVSLAVIQQVRGSNVYFGDLHYLDACLRQGRVHPAEMDTQRPTLTQSLFATQTSYGTKTLDLFKTTGVNWKVPRGFLARYNACNQHVLHAAAAAAGATQGSAREVVSGLWGRVTVDAFLDACRQVLGELSGDEEEYVAALASEQVPAGSAFIRDIAYLDKCLQQGRTPTSIKGPQLLPTIFLNNTTSGLADRLVLRHTGGRSY